MEKLMIEVPIQIIDAEVLCYKDDTGDCYMKIGTYADDYIISVSKEFYEAWKKEFQKGE